MIGRGFGARAHTVLPEGVIQDDGVYGVGVGEVHVFAGRPIFGVGLVDEAVFAIAVVGFVGGLRAGSAEERRHDGGAGVVGVHRWRAQQRFNGANHVDGGEKRVFDEGDGHTFVRLGEGRVSADDQSDAAVGVDVVGAVLRVVFEDEDGGVVPVGAVGDGFNDAADGEIIVGEGSGGSGLAFVEAGSVIVGEAQLDELRHGVFSRFA